MTDLPGTAEIHADTGRVRSIRDGRQCSMQEAHRIAKQEAMTNAIMSAVTVDDIKPILVSLVGGLMP